MTLLFTPPPRTASPLSRLDPRWKLAAVVLAAAAVAAVHTPTAALTALAGAVLLAALGRLPLRWALTRVGAAVLFVAIFAVPLIFFPPPTGPVWAVGPATLSVAGAATAVVLVCKAAALVTLALVLLATAPLDATLKAAHALHAPGLLVQLTLLSYRYLFLLADELGRLRIALRVRGYRNRATAHSYRTIGARDGGVAGARLGAGGARRPGHALPRLRRPFPFAVRVPHDRRGRTGFCGHRRRGGRRVRAGLGTLTRRACRVRRAGHSGA